MECNEYNILKTGPSLNSGLQSSFHELAIVSKDKL